MSAEFPNTVVVGAVAVAVAYVERVDCTATWLENEECDVGVADAELVGLLAG